MDTHTGVPLSRLALFGAGGIMNRWFLQSWCDVNSRLGKVWVHNLGRPQKLVWIGGLGDLNPSFL